MEFEIALFVNLALFTLYSALLITLSVDEAKRGEKEEALRAKQAA